MLSLSLWQTLDIPAMSLSLSIIWMLRLLYRSDRQSLLHKIQVLEHQVNNVSMGSSLSSQTQVLDWEQHRQTGRQVQHKQPLDKNIGIIITEAKVNITMLAKILLYFW